jgi:hypothetical protein
MPQQVPPGWGPPQASAPQGPGWGQPTTGWVNPNTMYAMQGPVTPWAKIGAVFLDVMGILLILFGLLAIVGGTVIRDITNSSSDSSGLGDFFGGAVAVIGIIIAFIGVLQLLSGLFAWRGSGGGRAGGIIFGLLFGILGLLGLAGSLSASSQLGSSSSGGGSGLVVSLIVTVGYLYTAAVFLVAFREKR